MRIGRAADDRGAILVDLSAANDQLTSDGDNYHDCRHLSDAGNAIVARVFYDTIDR